MRVKLENAQEVSILKIDRVSLREVCTAAALHCYDNLKQQADDPEAVAYHKGLLAFIQGLEAMVKDQVRPMPEEPPLTAQSKAQRLKAVRAIKEERQFIDSIIEEHLRSVGNS